MNMQFDWEKWILLSETIISDEQRKADRKEKSWYLTWWPIVPIWLIKWYQGSQFSLQKGWEGELMKIVNFFDSMGDFTVWEYPSKLRFIIKG